MRVSPIPIGLILVLALSVAVAAEAPDQKRLVGFSDESATRHRSLERRFDSHLRRDNLGEWMKRMSIRPHHVGSPFGKEVAQFIASQFRAWGYETEIETYHVLFPTPKERLLEMIEPERFTARLVEPELKEDSTSAVTQEALPTYNAYSVDGDITGNLVYVNYGVPRDYQDLEQRGVDVKGKIVIARYGGSWRGIKPKVAAEHGAVGCVIYSDPRDDGYFQGDVYPIGAWRSEGGAQRGSVADMPLHPGDPLTPGVGATENARRLEMKDVRTLTRIPVLPISYSDALPLLRSLGGPVAPQSWRGALPITYHIGPGPAKVHLKLAFDWKRVPAYNVIAKLRGSEMNEEWIIRGNHHDAWVFGANDPLSGTVAVMEEARAIGELARSGWRPKRTIVYALWDGEEPGLLGSTEWVEDHADLLDKHAAVYINSDTNGRGFLQVGGSHALQKLVSDVARDVVDPQKKISVLERALALRNLRLAADDESVTPARDSRSVRGGKSADLRIAALGSGSDYTPFLQHLGVTSLNIGYGGENGGGEYHSIYDSYDHYTRFKDPGFDYGVALAQTAGRVVLRLAEADFLPMLFTSLSATIDGYLKDIAQLVDEMRESTSERNLNIVEGTYQAVFDPRQPYVLPKTEGPVPFMNFAPLQNAIASLRESAGAYDRAVQQQSESGRQLPLERRKQLDQALIRTERAMTNRQGLPRRPWFRHQIYAPGAYTGYGVKTLPGVREAVEQRNWQEAAEQIDLLSRTIARLSDQIDAATRIVKASQ